MFSCVQLCGRAVFSCVHRLFGISRCVHSCASRSRWPRCVHSCASRSRWGRAVFSGQRLHAMPCRNVYVGVLLVSRLGVSHRFYLIGKPFNPPTSQLKREPPRHRAGTTDLGRRNARPRDRTAGAGRRLGSYFRATPLRRAQMTDLTLTPRLETHSSDSTPPPSDADCAPRWSPQHRIANIPRSDPAGAKRLVVLALRKAAAACRVSRCSRAASCRPWP